MTPSGVSNWIVGTDQSPFCSSVLGSATVLRYPLLRGRFLWVLNNVSQNSEEFIDRLRFTDRDTDAVGRERSSHNSRVEQALGDGGRGLTRRQPDEVALRARHRPALRDERLEQGVAPSGDVGDAREQLGF